MGSSAGANITYRTCLRAAVETNLNHDYLKPIQIRGFIMCQPFFGGTKRMASELRLSSDAVLPPHVCDLMWELALPVGVDRDHEYCNPTVGDNVLGLENIRRLGWCVLVTDCDGDPLVDRSIGLVRLMEEKRVKVVGHFTKGDYHGVQDKEPLKAKELFGVIQKFVSSLPNHTM